MFLKVYEKIRTPGLIREGKKVRQVSLSVERRAFPPRPASDFVKLAVVISFAAPAVEVYEGLPRAVSCGS